MARAPLPAASAPVSGRSLHDAKELHVGRAAGILMPAPFRDRTDAGHRLAEALSGYAHRADVIVLGLPRGGVPVAYEVAHELGVPMDVFLVRKLGTPGHEELALGAIASGGVRVVNREVVDLLRIPERTIAAVAAHEQQELERREREYRRGRPLPALAGRTVILVDDGLATGSTMRAAAAAVRAQGPARTVVAVPVAAAQTCAALRREVDDVVCAVTPEPFRAVGLWYEHFEQTDDAEVRALLERARRERDAGAAEGAGARGAAPGPAGGGAGE